MSTLAEGPARERESFAGDVAGMFSFLISPSSAARRVFRKWFWVAPLVLFSIVSVIAAYSMIPITLRVMESMGMSDQQLVIASRMQHVVMWFAPISAAAIYAVEALILYSVASVSNVNARFGPLFNLIAGCSLIQMLAAIAGVIIIRAKGEVSSMAELRPALGIDIFLPGGTNRFLVAFLGYFSIFELWWIVMLVLIFSDAFRVSRGKAFSIILPLIAISIIFRMVAVAFGR